MNSIKRKRILYDFSDEQKKKSMIDGKSSIEIFSNELFYEIFDYLDGWDLYQAFVNLNEHFQKLLHSPFLRLKIQLNHWRTNDQLENNWKQMIEHHREQIFSMNFSIVPSTIDFFSFNHLQSLTLHYVEVNVCLSVLRQLTSLQYLSSLTIYLASDSTYLSQIYRIILALPMLIYYKFSADDCHIDPPLPMATSEQLNSIEILVIDHLCCFEEIVSIVSYSPHLRQLQVTDSVVSMPKITLMSPTALSNLTDLTMVAHTFQFRDIELLIKRMDFKLKMLDIRASDDFSFLHADRWEQLIVQHLPYLEKFSLFYQETIVECISYETYRGRLNPFLTSFWIERQWFLDIEIDDQYTNYSIQPYRKQWYEDFPENSPIEFSKSTGLLLTYTGEDRSKITPLKRTLKVAQIYHLQITKKEFSIPRLIQIIEFFPDLHTLTIDSLSPTSFSSKELQKFSTTKNTGKITEVYLEQMNSVNDIDFLLTLCPALISFKVNSIKTMTIASCLRLILDKVHRSLRSLCFYHPTAGDQLLKDLEKIIVNENLLRDFAIKRVFNEIRLQWK